HRAFTRCPCAIRVPYGGPMTRSASISLFVPLSLFTLVASVTGCAVGPTEPAEGCNVEQLDDGSARITCPDGSSAVVKPGRDGVDGEDGTDGADGLDGADGVDGADGAPGVDGADGAPGVDGADGAPGVDGADGPPGAPGGSCSVEDVGGGTRRISCEDGSEVFISDGGSA